jgi:hypothetical protein
MNIFLREFLGLYINGCRSNVFWCVTLFIPVCTDISGVWRCLFRYVLTFMVGDAVYSGMHWHFWCVTLYIAVCTDVSDEPAVPNFRPQYYKNELKTPASTMEAPSFSEALAATRLNGVSGPKITILKFPYSSWLIQSFCPFKSELRVL